MQEPGAGHGTSDGPGPPEGRERLPADSDNLEHGAFSRDAGPRHAHPIRIVSEPGETDSPRIAAPTHIDIANHQERKPPTEPKLRPDLVEEELLRGSHPGDRYVRLGRRAGPFRRKRPGVLTAGIEAHPPRSNWGRFYDAVRRVLIGRPIPNEHSIHERLTNVKALAVLSSDALSSVAYATEEILRILVLAGVGAMTWGLPLGLAIMALMVIVVASYRQTIAAYPRGGGTYIVAKDNLGTLPGLAAASSILIGYTLTVAVSVAAGIAALYSLFPALISYRVALALVTIGFITIANLRGLREAGNIFAVPTYVFIVGVVGMIGYGLLRLFFGLGGPLVYVPPERTLIPQVATSVGILLLLRAFTQGSAALTGVEAIADGVPAFRPPEDRNARRTLLYMGVISVVMFGGITFLATRLGVIPSDQETVVSQIARTVFGRDIAWYFIQVATALILVLAANTAFADFPRLSYFLARDKFMPRQYAFRGERLAFSWGIVTLATLAGILIVLFNGETSALIPLYAIGVMGAFTFSQLGMVVRWWRRRPRGWVRNLLMNGVGAIVTFTVFVIATFTKLDKGTWVVLILIPLQIGLFLAINRHYRRVALQTAAPPTRARVNYRPTFVVPVSGIDSVSLAALDYARSLSRNITAVHIVEGEDPEEARRFDASWHEYFAGDDIPLVIIESPYRALIGPLLAYIDALDQQFPDDTITVVLPEFLPVKPWEYLLHYQSALRLKAALLFRANTVTIDVPYRLSAPQKLRGPFGTLAALPWLPLMMLLAILSYLLSVILDFFL